VRSDKKASLKSDKKTTSKVQKKGVVGYNKKSALLEDAITQMNAGKYGRASTVLKDLLALDPLNAEARRLFATLHLRLGSLMSARAAFESLAREAMERQDYWLAESLLREYLTAGPRCVPFLEMLGQVYEDKGDVMAAVAEYGKAVEVLLEDPDSENPNRAGDLFGKIRSLAPGSPVAFRFAAMFDAVTGHMLQAAPPSAVVEADGESSPTDVESPEDHAVAVAMPWEQVEAAPPESPVDTSPKPMPVPAAGDPPDNVNASDPPVSIRSIIEETRQEVSPEPIPTPPSVDASPMSEQQAPGEGELSDVAAISASADGPVPTTAAEAGALVEADHARPSVETVAPSLEVLMQAEPSPIAAVPGGPTPMPWDQIEETAEEIPPGTESQRPGDTEASPPLEILPQTSALLITEPPASPVSMSWDQVEESAGRAPTEPPPAPAASGIISSELTWEEILAAVTAMQATPPATQMVATVERDPTSDVTLSEEAWATAAPPVESREPVSLSFTAPASDSFGGHVEAAPPLSSPMPWEQVETDDVSIPRPDPEPEFGPVPSGSADGDFDPTMVLTGLSEVHESVPVTEAPADVPAIGSLVQEEVPSQSEFRILSSDAPVKPREQLIHIPSETIVPAEESAPVVDLSAEPSFRLTVGESISEVGHEERSEPPVEVPVESAAATFDAGSVTLAQTDGQGTQAPVVESTEPALSEPPPLVGQPAIQIPIQESTISVTQEVAAESPVVSVAPLLSTDQSTVPAASNEHAPSEDVLLEGLPLASTPEVSSGTQSRASVPETVAYDTGWPQPAESIASPLVRQAEPAVPFVEEVQAAHMVPAAEAQPPVAVVQAASEPAADGSLRIVQDNPSPVSTQSASIGNMLARWLKKSAPAFPVETDHPAPTPDEPTSSAVPSSVDPQEEITIVAESPVEQPERTKPVAGEASTIHLKSRKPAEAGALYRIGHAAASFSRTCFSTTRSLVISVLALIGLALVLAAGTVAGIVLTWLVLEEQPTATYHTMMAVPQRTLPESGKNGYFLLLGFGAATTQDPLQAGMDRRAEDADRTFTDACLMGAGHSSGVQQGASAEMLGKWLKGADPAAQIRMSATGVKSWVAQAEVSMGRYRQWLTMPFEDWGYGQPVSPNCGVILHVHRLYVAEGFAQDIEAGIGRLETDLGAWRTVLGQAKTLPLKMLAGDALNDDVALVGGLLLRSDLDDGQVSRLAKLVRPLDQAEQSVRWPMQSRFASAVKTLDENLTRDKADTRPFYASIAASLPLPRQRLFNAYAEYYEAAGKAAAEGRVVDIPKQSQFVRRPPFGLTDLFVNPIESLVGIDQLPSWETYAGRVLETDARLRLASLQAWLRRTPPEQDLLTRIAKAGQGLYDPFTGFPMLVNMKKRSLYSVGPNLKDDEAQERFDLVVSIPPPSLAAGKRSADPNKVK
jgi:hypothetical protein